jgi:hypothetical protein
MSIRKGNSGRRTISNRSAFVLLVQTDPLWEISGRSLETLIQGPWIKENRGRWDSNLRV